MWKTLSLVLRRKKYILVALSTALVYAGLSYHLTVVNIFHRSIWFFSIMNGVWYTVATVVMIFVVASAFGTYIAFLIFRHDLIKQTRALGNKVAGLSGTILGIAASGCPSCGAPALALFGFPLGLFSLPLQGLEIKLLSFMFLVVGIYLIDRNIKKSLVCSVIKA